MFSGLNGATRMPRRFAARHSPATTTDFPASDAVPWIITARALTPARSLDEMPQMTMLRANCAQRTPTHSNQSLAHLAPYSASASTINEAKNG